MAESSDLSEWQRSADAKERRRRRQMLGTATVGVGIRTIWLHLETMLLL